MTVIPLGAGLPRRSSHLPADLSEPLIARQDCACSIRLFGVAPGGGYRVSPLGAPDARTSPRAGPKDSSLWPCSSSSPKASLQLVRTAVSRHPALWSPDFPLRTLRVRSDRLASFTPQFSHLRRARRRLMSATRCLPCRTGSGYFLRLLRGAASPPPLLRGTSCLPRCGCTSSAGLRPARKCCASS